MTNDERTKENTLRGEEFDEKALKEFIDSIDPDDWEEMGRMTAITAGARWQFDRQKAELELAKQENYDVRCQKQELANKIEQMEFNHNNTERELDAAKARIAEVEAEIRALRTAKASKDMFCDQLEKEYRHDKNWLEARVREMEAENNLLRMANRCLF